nr:zinc-binding dehydrogenase [Phytoactinopolyspora mesophila]
MIVGQGLVGQLTAMLARLRGAYVIGTEISKEKIAISSTHCVDWIIDAAASLPSEQLAGRFPDGVDTVLHTANVSIKDSLRCVRSEGTFIWVGGNAVEGITFDIEEPHLKEIRWIFAHGVGDAKNVEHTLRMLSTGIIDIGPLITHKVNWNEAADVYNELFGRDRDRLNGIVIDWRDAE